MSVRIGYGATNIIFKEALQPSVNLFGRTFKTGKTYVAEGPEFGISKDLNSNIYLDIGFSSFSGGDTRVEFNNSKNYYNLKGFQIPLTINYLFRDKTKKIRFNVGTGINYLKAHLQQYESSTLTNSQVVNQISDINISELQFALRPGIEFRVIPNLFISWMIRVSLSTNGRYVDNPVLSLRYSFKTGKK